MKHLCIFLTCLLLASCGPALSPDAASIPDNPEELFLSGLREVSAGRSPAHLEEFLRRYPRHPYAETAGAVLEYARLQQQLKSKYDALLKTSQRQEGELKQLRSDLDRLRKLLIEAEQRAP